MITMNSEFRYQLETRKLTGRRQQKFQCPNCGKNKCFVRYVDTQNAFSYLADEVGKCDHLNSCGYHYKPSQYFHDYQLQEKPALTHYTPPPPPPFQPIPMDYVLRSHSTQSSFWGWLSNVAARQLCITPQQLQRIFDDYLIGATSKHNVIFWQIDHLNRVHGGHIMQYGNDGHRKGFQGWTHIPLIQAGKLPLNWQLYQCLFGQHLLSQRPEAHVCLVESEKTALVLAALHPEHIWLATAGCSGLTPERLGCLRGRRLTAFPDSGCYQKWLQQLQAIKGLDFNISQSLEEYPPNTDLCDLLLEQS